MQSMLDLTDQISEAQTYIERAEAMLGEITEEYFNDIGTNNPDTPKGRSNIISGFEQNRVIAEIARDYAVQTRQVLNRMGRRVKAETVKVLTGEVRLSRVNVVTPEEPPQDSAARYSVTLLIPKADSATKTAIDSAIQAAFLDVWARNRERSRALPRLIHDGDGASPSGEPFGAECKGCWVLTASTKIKPQVVGMGDITKEIPASYIYSGMFGRVTIYFHGYYKDGNINISCGLGHNNENPRW